MKISILSGKGGVGKTTIASSLVELDNGITLGTEIGVVKDLPGKLINHLRENGREFNSDEQLIISDESTGSESAIISSIIGSDVVLVVAEPTKSGFEHLMRVVALCEQFGVFTMVCINKFDINEEMSNKIEEFVKNEGLVLVGKIQHNDVIEAIDDLKPIKDYENSKAFSSIKDMWQNIRNYIC
ncbi:MULTISPECIES: CobQ/CobB/MinD/ParA nucleotide binding domain-containing protein [unclassified Clostridium]|uniref:CobQ/CobB/MinD/ParA nucleotide binding domain-containing protein n=1 Tax=unclassified Clostridium TaxID=2614128 RepID=UPI000297583A|nr:MULTISPECIES: CobQ/CobB/MinD/ParA nucleotide binding domain-containing protein [unclassified Clostridium]EKQ52821.1 MAG: CobQ/CobB/MinD/ParA nucleotide binding domain-containing protein [Clostridium sp. Maddingley MBC34-26]